MTQTHYKVILDEEKLKSFIDWLPELHKKETYYVCLFARGKYTEQMKINGGQLQLRRFISKKEFLFQKIMQLEVPYGAFTNNGVPIPQESLALYINPNPRNIEKASRKAVIKLTHLVLESYNGYNPYTEILSEMQVATGRKVNMNFDFDDVEISDTIAKIKENNILNLDVINVVKTRGGFHLLIETEKIHNQYKKSWYLQMTRLPGWDKKSGSTDGLMPVPGCTQGGFSPYLFPAVSPQLVEQKT